MPAYRALTERQIMVGHECHSNGCNNPKMVSGLVSLYALFHTCDSSCWKRTGTSVRARYLNREICCQFTN